MKHYYLILLSFLCFSFSAFSQEVGATLDRDEIKIGDQTYIEIEVRCSAAAQSIMMPQLIDTISKFIEIVQVGNIDTTFDEEDITIKVFRQRIIITSWDSGFHAISPFLISIDGTVYKTDPLLLTVNSVPIKADQDIKDINSIIEVPFSLTDWMITHRNHIGIVVLAILLIVGLVLLIKKLRNKPLQEFKMSIPKEAADVVAFKKLSELENKKLWQNNQVKEYQSELSFIVREYIENRYHIRALEMTTDELITALSPSSEVEEGEKKRLHQLLLTADMAKFAKQQPVASENEDSLKIAKLFIQETKYIAQSNADSTEASPDKEVSL